MLSSSWTLVSARLIAAVSWDGISSGPYLLLPLQARSKLGADRVDKVVGNLLYHMATRFKGPEERSAMLMVYICSRKIATEPQITGVCVVCVCVRTRAHRCVGAYVHECICELELSALWNVYALQETVCVWDRSWELQSEYHSTTAHTAEVCKIYTSSSLVCIDCLLVWHPLIVTWDMFVGPLLCWNSSVLVVIGVPHHLPHQNTLVDANSFCEVLRLPYVD